MADSEVRVLRRGWRGVLFGNFGCDVALLALFTVFATASIARGRYGTGGFFVLLAFPFLYTLWSTVVLRRNRLCLGRAPFSRRIDLDHVVRARAERINGFRGVMTEGIVIEVTYSDRLERVGNSIGIGEFRREDWIAEINAWAGGRRDT